MFKYFAIFHWTIYCIADFFNMFRIYNLTYNYSLDMSSIELFYEIQILENHLYLRILIMRCSHVISYFCTFYDAKTFSTICAKTIFTYSYCEQALDNNIISNFIIFDVAQHYVYELCA